MSFENYFKSVFASVLALAAVACGSSGSSPNPPVPISVTFQSQPVSSLNTGGTMGIVAIVTNDSQGAGVTWSVSCGSSSCGSFNPATTGSGSTATYTAPSAVPSAGTVTVTATSVTDASKSASATIKISAPAGIAVSLSTQPPSTMVVNTKANIAATVSNDSKNGGVTWALHCGSSSCGSLSAASTASGATTSYTAPSTVPSPATVTITATSVTDATKSAWATVTITASAPSVLSDGTYVYHFSGQDDNGPYSVAGAFSIKSGAITGGEQDFSNATLGSSDSLVPASCNISATNGNVEIVLATANTNIGVNGVETLHGTMISSTRMAISEFDSVAAAIGSIDLQTSTAALSGGYAFAINGLDTNTGNQLAIGGVLNFANGSLSAANSVFDFNDQGVGLALGQSFSSGSVSAADAYGRVSINLTPTNTQIDGFTLSAYLVDGDTIQLIESQGDALNANLGGVALAQGSHTGTFGTASIANSTYVHAGQGQDTNGPVFLGGSFVFAAGGTASGNLVFNDLYQPQTGNTFTGASYSVSPTGRVVITSVVPSSLQVPLSFTLYLDGAGNALTLGADDIEQTAGVAFVQTGPSDYEGNYAISAQGFLGYSSNGNNFVQPFGAVGPVSITSNTFDGFTDYTWQDQNQMNFDTSANTSLNGQEDTTNRSLNLSGLNAIAGFGQTSSFDYYPIDNNRVLAIEVDGNAMGLVTLESTGQLQK